MEKRKLGGQGLKVSAMGLGCMGISEFYGATLESESLVTLQPDPSTVAPEIGNSGFSL